MLSMGREVACIKASFYIIAVSKMKCKGKNKINGSGFRVRGSGFARVAYRPLIEDESSARQLEVRSVGAAHKNMEAPPF